MSQDHLLKRLFFPPLNYLGTFVKNQLTKVWGYLTWCSNLIHYLCTSIWIKTTVSWLLWLYAMFWNRVAYVLQLYSSFFYLCPISIHILGSTCPILHIHYLDLRGIVFNLQMDLRISILTIVNLWIYGHGISCNLFRSLISLNMFYKFHCTSPAPFG